MLTARPHFKKELLAYERPEKDGYYTFVPKYHPETMELIINATSRQILTLCDGARSLDGIVGEMARTYPDVPQSKLQQDVFKTIANFSRLAIVEWDGENPFLFRQPEPTSEGRTLVIGQEADIVRIREFLDRMALFTPGRSAAPGLLTYASPFCTDKDYQEIALRHKLFAYSEEFFLLMAGQTIAGLISIATPLGQDTVAQVRLLVCPAESVLELWQYARGNFLYLTVKNVTKIRLLEPLATPLQADLRTKLGEMSFGEEAMLRSEMGFGGDLRLFGCFLEPEFVRRIESLRSKGQFGN